MGSNRGEGRGKTVSQLEKSTGVHCLTLRLLQIALYLGFEAGKVFSSRNFVSVVTYCRYSRKEEEEEGFQSALIFRKKSIFQE